MKPVTPEEGLAAFLCLIRARRSIWAHPRFDAALIRLRAVLDRMEAFRDHGGMGQ